MGSPRPIPCQISPTLHIKPLTSPEAYTQSRRPWAVFLNIPEGIMSQDQDRKNGNRRKGDLQKYLRKTISAAREPTGS